MSDYGLLAPVVAQLESWTVEDAIQAFGEWRKNGGEVSDPANPVAQWSTWNEGLPALQQRHEEGDPRAVLKALELCAMHSLPMPAWCRQSYLSSWRKAKWFECRTLDEAFDYSAKGTKLDYARQAIRLADLITISAIERQEAGETIEEVLQSLGAEYGVGFTRAKEWYYSRRDHLRGHLPLSAKPQKRRKDGD